MKKLIVASNNKHKIQEIAELLKDRYKIVSMAQAGIFDEIEENGSTFYENAYIKASYISNKLGVDALADDSGLCVDALGGAPGVLSARYGGENTDDKKNIELLLENIKDEKIRAAYFECCIVLCKKDGGVLCGQGRSYGEILYKPKGFGGFGYDCVFYSLELKKSFGEATAREKNSVSHRFRALEDLKAKM